MRKDSHAYNTDNANPYVEGAVGTQKTYALSMGSYEGYFIKEEFDKHPNVNFIGSSFTKMSNIIFPEVLRQSCDALNVEILSIRTLNKTGSVITFQPNNKAPVFIIHFEISASNYFDELYVKTTKDYTITCRLFAEIFSMGEYVEIIKGLIFSPNTEHPSISWACLQKNDIVYADLPASKNNEIKDVIYPWIKEGVDQFYEDYINSTSSILVMLGPPGTGKTSFIRNFIYKKSMDAVITYDTDLLQSDSFFIQFIDGSNNLMVLEDYDRFLMSRENSENNVMSKFLNLSEGLVDISKKKLLFTANIEKNKIDPALLRAGRCYKVLEFREYTTKEAQAVCNALELNTKVRDGMTLAELFNEAPTKKTKVGFY